MPEEKPVSVGSTRSNLGLIEPGEHLVTVIYRHPIGLIGIYAVALAGLAALIGLTFAISGSTPGKIPERLFGLLAGGSIFIIAFLALVFLAAVYVYRQSRMVVTDQSLVQVLQSALFSRKVAHLSMSNVEDVKVEQRGILPMIFNYGTLTVETAGAVENFIFAFCPNPHKYASRILEARQLYVRTYQDGA
ncbi:MAG: PH domain-containing protein [Candidatus Saccharimonadales bacterium]